MATNVFSCPICNCNTRHIEVTLAEAGAAAGGGRFFKVLNGINDLSGANKIMQFISGQRCWKCGNCASIFVRNTSGEIQNVIKQGEPNNKENSKYVVYIPQTTINLLINSTTVNNYYLNANTASEYPWLHKQDGFVGNSLDRYKIILHGDKISSEEQKKALTNTLFNLNLGLGQRENIQWKLSQGRNRLEWTDLTKEQAIGIYNKVKNSFLIEYVQIV